MTLIPHRTVSSQIAAHLRAEIAKGAWRDWLPGERELARTLQASRNTIHVALDRLRADGVIETVRGVGNRLLHPAQPSRGLDNGHHDKSVGLLIPQPIRGLRSWTTLWVDELKDLLLEEHVRLRVHEGRQFDRANPGPALDRLVSQHAHDAWVLTLSSAATQRWFARRGIPCLLAGTAFPDVTLPHCDLDYHTTCRHAADVLLRLGHRQIALLNRESRRAGDLESEAGFLEAARTARAEVTTAISWHHDDVSSVSRALARLLDRNNSPTGLIVSNSYAYLATVTLLAQRGLRVPQDISVISRNDDPFLAAVAPTPARYVASPIAFAKKLLSPLLQLTHGERLVRPRSLLLPKFVTGGSVGPPPEPRSRIR
jgi:DNA-binding LacI/PurR family transcriptional regulator